MKEKEKVCILLAAFVLANSWLSLNHELFDRSCKTNKGTKEFLLY
jgi:hypothetical protein